MNPQDLDASGDEPGRPSVRALLEESLPYDRIAPVVAEKLLGSNGPRDGHAVIAERAGAPVGVMATAGRWIKLLVTAPEARRSGVGTSLLAHARGRSAAGARLRLCDHPGNYLTPGLDVRCAEARAFFERRGFRVVGEVENLRVPISNNPLVTPKRARALAEAALTGGYSIARATPADRAALLTLIESSFSPVWAYEVTRALDGPRRAVHLARRTVLRAGDVTRDTSRDVPRDVGRDVFTATVGEIVAFAAADGNNQGLGWFGPAGTLPEHRGHGLGEALLIACLLDVASLAEGGVIAWIGPKSFYERAAGAVSDRRFWSMEEA